MDKDIVEQIKSVLEKIRPFIQRDGGDVTFDHYDESTGTVYVSFVGACVGCMMLDDTLHLGIETILIEEVPGVNAVKLV